MATDEALKDDEDQALLAEILERTLERSPAALAYLERRRLHARNVDDLCGALEAIGMTCGARLRRKLLVLTLEQEQPAPTLVIAILETEDGDPPSRRYVLRLLGELKREAEDR